jgi:hypothetical protein
MDSLVALCTAEKCTVACAADWEVVLGAFAKQHATTFDFTDLWTREDQKLACEHLYQVVSGAGWGENVVLLALKCVKIIVRTRKWMTPFATPAGMATLLQKVAQEDGIEDVTRFEGLCVVLNILIVNQQKNLGVFVGVEDSFVLLLGLLVDGSDDVSFLAARCLFYAALDDKLCELLIADDIYSKCATLIIRESNYKHDFDKFSDLQSAEGQLRRRKVSWTTKVLFNILMEKDKRQRFNEVTYVSSFHIPLVT